MKIIIVKMGTLPGHLTWKGKSIRNYRKMDHILIIADVCYGFIPQVHVHMQPMIIN